MSRVDLLSGYCSLTYCKTAPNMIWPDSFQVQQYGSNRALHQEQDIAGMQGYTGYTHGTYLELFCRDEAAAEGMDRIEIAVQGARRCPMRPCQKTFLIDRQRVKVA